MLLVHASLRPSAIHGLGCFTDEPIAKGEVIWVFDPRVDIRLPVEELAALPQPIRAYYAKYGYAEMAEGRKVITLCGDHSKHMNHAAEPNVLSLSDRDVAARDIAAGEELTCDYRTFDLDATAKLRT